MRVMLEIEKKVFRTISKYKLIENKDKIFVALSGGKDSATVCFLLSKYVKENKIDCEINAFHLILGDFIPKTVLNIVKKQASICKVKLKVYNVKNFGIDFEKLTNLERPICSFCGMVKRYLMNKIPREEGATKLCTGHNADDFLVFFFKNMLSKNIFWISKFLPKLEGRNKQLTRIRPLFFVSQEETKDFCKKEGIPFVEEDVCPYVILKQKMDRKREKWYKLIKEISSWQPNFRENFLQSVISVAGILQNNLSFDLKECEICKEPTSMRICSFCRLKERIKSGLGGI